MLYFPSSAGMHDVAYRILFPYHKHAADLNKGFDMILTSRTDIESLPLAFKNFEFKILKFFLTRMSTPHGNLKIDYTGAFFSGGSTFIYATDTFRKSGWYVNHK